MGYSKGQRFFFGFFRSLLKWPISWKFGFKTDQISSVRGPYILLSNHTTDFDPIFLSFAANTPLTFVASEHIAHKGWISRLLVKTCQPILHTKGKMGIATTRAMLTGVKEGKNIALFPEGNRSFLGKTGTIPPVTGKLIKKAGVPLVTYRLSGGYFTQPRWGLGFRKGKIRGKLVHIYSVEELAAMNDREIQQKIVADLAEDAYAPSGVELAPYKGNHPARGLESALYYCPHCAGFGTLSSGENNLTCSCGWNLLFHSNGLLTDPGGKEYRLTEMEEWQRSALKKKALSAPAGEILFRDKVRLSTVSRDHSSTQPVDTELSASTSGLTIGERFFPWEELEGVAVYSRNVLVIHPAQEENHPELRGDVSFNALKYYELFQLLGSGKIRGAS